MINLYFAAVCLDVVENKDNPQAHDLIGVSNTLIIPKFPDYINLKLFISMNCNDTKKHELKIVTKFNLPEETTEQIVPHKGEANDVVALERRIIDIDPLLIKHQGGILIKTYFDDFEIHEVILMVMSRDQYDHIKRLKQQ